MYVGSHTWDGPKGAVDEDYHGSSVIACKYGWVPVEVSILEVVSEERKYVAEREWILKYCNEFGVHPIVKKLHPDFGLQFKTGVLINCHSNSYEYLRTAESNEKRVERLKEIGHYSKLLEARRQSGALKRWIVAGHLAGKSDESRRKMVNTQKVKGSFQRFQKLGLAASISEESKLKRVKSLMSDGGFERFQSAGVEASLQEVAIRKRVENTDYKVVAEKSNKTKKEKSKKGWKRASWIVEVYKDGSLVKKGRLNTVCSELGNVNWAIRVAVKLREHKETEHHGFVFKVIH